MHPSDRRNTGQRLPVAALEKANAPVDVVVGRGVMLLPVVGRRCQTTASGSRLGITGEGRFDAPVR